MSIGARILLYPITSPGKDGELDKHSKEKLASLRAELERIRKIKADYVAEHPEHAKLVYKSGSSRQNDRTGDRPPQPAARSLFGPNGLPLNPERSIYYDEKMNPFGMPPPGMPYVERRKLAIRSFDMHLFKIASSIAAP